MSVELAYTLEEQLRYNADKFPPGFVDAFEGYKKELHDNAELRAQERFNRDEELLHEQIYFAQNLLEEIEAILNDNTRATEIKKAIAAAIGNSMFER